jgi:tyrosyl-tRNA synthetase
VAVQSEVQRQIREIKRGVVEIYNEDELVKRVEKSITAKKPLRVKLGLDPSTSDIHIGHGVPLRKLRAFQDLGHHAVLIAGDFTALIGDPSERNTTRPMLTRQQIEHNVRTYVEQAGKIVDAKRLEIRYNSEWLAPMDFRAVIDLCSKMTVARMLERDYFSKRFKEGTPIAIHELFYPLMQGCDSVMVKADIELGGQDQTFNLLVGRDLMREEGLEPQICITMPLLAGLDGVNKMSKSLGNYIGVTDPPEMMFGKAMSIPDHLMRNYFELATTLPMEEIAKLLKPEAHPRAAKARLAGEIVRQFWGDKAARAAEKAFDEKFRERKTPDEMPEHFIPAASLKDGKVWLTRLLVELGFAPSNSEARRKITQGAVTVFTDANEGKKFTDENLPVKDGMILRIGKKKEHVRLRLKA